MRIGPTPPASPFSPIEDPPGKAIAQLQNLLRQLQEILGSGSPLTPADIARLSQICQQIAQLLTKDGNVIFNQCQQNGWPPLINHDGYDMRYHQLLQFVENFPTEAKDHPPNQMTTPAEMINESLTQLLFFLTSKH